MAAHDAGYKLLFSHPRMVADLLRGFVPEAWVAGLDFATLERVNASFVAESLRGREDDLVWRLRWGRRWIYVYLLLEFQSTVERFMALRMLVYVGLLYQELIRSGEIGARRCLPPVVPVVLYNGERRWSAPEEIGDLIEVPPGGLEHHVPRLRYLLLDEGRYPEGALAGQRNVVAALFRLERSRDPQAVAEVLGALIEWLGAPQQASLRRAFAVWVRQVLLPARIPGVEIPEVVELQEVRSMLAERVKEWTEQWKAEGLAEGRAEGLALGIEEGRRKGLEEGREEGREEGERRVLRRLLERRFGALPPWAEQRLASAGVDELEGWADRLLGAGDLAGVLGPPPDAGG